MTEFLIKSTLAMGVLLGLYYILFKREKMHNFNRFYLLSALVFSLALPLIKYNRYYEAAPAQIDTVTALHPIAATIVNNKIPAPMAAGDTDYIPYLSFGIYSLVAAVMALRFVLNIAALAKKTGVNLHIKKGNAIIVLTEEKTQPYTFLKYIFINRQDYENKLIEKELYQHELAHVKQKHTLDILFIEILKVIFWFNPLLYFYKKAIQLNHEFLADEKVITATKNIPYYQNLLLARVSVSYIPLTSSISYSITKNRFLMMTKTSGKIKIAFKQFLVIPVISLLFAFLCINTIAKASNTVQQISTEKQETPTEKDKRRDSYYAGVRMIIEDKPRSITIDKPYEELTLEQKREYLFYVPVAKTKKSPTAKELKDYKDKSKYAIWIDGKNVDNTVLDKYKNTDFVYATVSPVNKNARTKQHPQPFQFSLYTNAYFDKNLKYDHLKYPSKVFTLSISREDKKKQVASKQENKSHKPETKALIANDSVSGKIKPVNQSLFHGLSGIPSDKVKSIMVNKNVTQHQVDSLKQATPKMYVSNDPKDYGKITIDYTDESGNPARKKIFKEE